jgi:polyisoprenoid-binding protein YceI
MVRKRPAIPRSARLVALAAGLATALSAATLSAAPWRVDAERSVFAVLTHKAGLGARLAHDHLILARGAEVTFDFEPDDPGAARATVAANVLALDVDPAAERRELSPRLVELGLLAAPLPVVDEGDRAKVRKAMLEDGQLAAERFPELRGELVELTPAAAPDAGGERRGEANLRLTVRGRTREVVMPVTWRLAGGELAAEGTAALHFSDFGIRPYSTLLGAIRNDDRFDVYVRLVAHPAAGEDPAAGAH